MQPQSNQVLRTYQTPVTRVTRKIHFQTPRQDPDAQAMTARDKVEERRIIQNSRCEKREHEDEERQIYPKASVDWHVPTYRSVSVASGCVQKRVGQREHRTHQHHPEEEQPHPGPHSHLRVRRPPAPAELMEALSWSAHPVPTPGCTGFSHFFSSREKCEKPLDLPFPANRKNHLLKEDLDENREAHNAELDRQRFAGQSLLNSVLGANRTKTTTRNWIVDDLLRSKGTTLSGEKTLETSTA